MPVPADGKALERSDGLETKDEPSNNAGSERDESEAKLSMFSRKPRD